MKGSSTLIQQQSTKLGLLFSKDSTPGTATDSSRNSSFHLILGIFLDLATLLHAASITEDGLELMNVTLPQRNLTGKDTTYDYHLSILTLFKAQGYDPSFYYHDYSTAQVWMGKKMTTVGSVIGKELYDAVYGALDRICPARPYPNGCSGVKNSNFEGWCMKIWPALTVPCKSTSLLFHALGH